MVQPKAFAELTLCLTAPAAGTLQESLERFVLQKVGDFSRISPFLQKPKCFHMLYLKSSFNIFHLFFSFHPLVMIPLSRTGAVSACW